MDQAKGQWMKKKRHKVNYSGLLRSITKCHSLNRFEVSKVIYNTPLQEETRSSKAASLHLL